MTDLFRAAQPGDPLAIPAETYNRLLRMLAEWQRQPKPQRQPAPPMPDGGLILLQNDSEEDIDLGQPRGIGTPQVYDPIEDLQSMFLGQQPPIFTAESTDSGAHAGLVAIAVEPIPSGTCGRARIQGICLAYVHVTDTAHAYADAANSDAHLASGPSGPAQILWTETGAVDESNQWAIVRLSNPNRANNTTFAEYIRFSLPGELTQDDADIASATVLEYWGGAGGNPGSTVTLENYPIKATDKHRWYGDSGNIGLAVLYSAATDPPTYRITELECPEAT